MDEQKKKEKKEEGQQEEIEAETVVTEGEEKHVQRELQVVTELARQFENQAKRLAADYQNLQKRTREEKSEWIGSASKDLILKILPVLDTLFLAQKHVQDKGLALAIDQFTKILENEGLERIETVGKQFDPITMEAVTTQEGEAGKVLEEVRVGYMMHGMLIRSAQVIVGQ
ncbi:MAG TPA: nucleotide exchange factor GrpE [Patescibacteria group bacterium]|nr:nucleotide exchange factor GrpE [Patescibacteria group bacterium]